MIRIVFKPLKAPVVDHEGLYSARFNGREFFKVRARNAAHAEAKLMYLMKRETSGKVLDFDLERQIKEERDDADRNRMRAGDETGSAGNCPPDP